MALHTLAVLVENSPGVLARVASLFSRRGYNIDSLAVGPTENPKVSRMTIVLNLEGHALDQVNAQLFKLVNVIGISEMKPTNSIQRELLLVKVANNSKSLEMVKKFGAKYSESNGVLEVEAVGERAQIEKFLSEFLRDPIPRTLIRLRNSLAVVSLRPKIPSMMVVKGSICGPIKPL